MRKRITASMTLGILVSTALSAGAKNAAVEFAKYFNPMQKKGYLNESQDRVIKKKAFNLKNAFDIEAAHNKETGIFALLKAEDIGNDSLIEDVLTRTDINGISVIVPWQKIEPAEDEFNWRPVDHLLALAGSHNKTVILRVSTCGVDLPAAPEPSESTDPGASAKAEESDGTRASGAPENQSKGSQGQPQISEQKQKPEETRQLENSEKFAASDTPQWVFDAGAKYLPYTAADGKRHRLPVFWDTTYLANWRNFVKSLGNRYDQNPAIHSIGITGGGMLGGTPAAAALDKSGLHKPADGGAQAKQWQEIARKLKTEHGMQERQIVQHWQYVADQFAKSFPKARLNFNVDPPVPGRKGQDELDQISDYLIYRYGERVYLTRHAVGAKHGFDEYRLLLKFKSDTLTGYQLNSEISADDLKKLVKSALDDGISFAEVPVALLASKEDAVVEPLKHLASHIGFEIEAKKATIPAQLKSGEPMKASFSFLNLGAAPLLRPERNLDKDVAASYRVMIELRDEAGKPVVLSLHTPPTPTNQWTAGRAINYDEELKMPDLPAGNYSVYLWLVDSESKRKVNLLDGISQQTPAPASSILLGQLQVTGQMQTIGASHPAPAQ